MKIQTLTPFAVNVSEKTNWFFVKIETDDGLAGWGEASLSGGWEENQILNVKRLAANITGLTIGGNDALRGLPLRALDLGITQVTDLGPLQGMKLERLDLENVPVTDISVLSGMPLKVLWALLER